MKKVHFAAVSATYIPPSVQSSPAYSLASISDSPALVYPRLLNEIGTSPVPSPPYQEMHIHFLLAFSPFGAPALQYDVSLEPFTSLEDQITSDTLNEPATEPQLARLTIINSHFPRPITITPSSHRTGYVTVADVFAAIWDHQRTCILPEDYKGLPSMDVVKQVDRAYYRRCRDSGDREGYERAQGIRMVDLLIGKSRFLGLSGTFHGSDVWELNVS